MYDNPITILDYLFMYSYVISIIAAIFFSISNILSIDVPNIFVNKNIRFILSIYLIICGRISLDIWFNAPILNKSNCRYALIGGYNPNCKDKNTIYVDKIPLYIISDIFNYYFNRNVVITKLT
jgi:hypothetical protein